MKNILFLVFSCFLISCTHNEPDIVYNYTIVNNSSQVLEIIPYNPQGTLSMLKKIVLAPGQIINKGFRDRAPYVGYDFTRFIDAGYTPKIEFVFNNAKRIIYERCPDALCSNPRNIFHFQNNIGQVQVYTITDDDFNVAIDCGGNCN